MTQRPGRETDLTFALPGELLGRVEAAGSPIRDDILGSWRRSSLAGLTPDAFDVPLGEVDDRSRLAWAAGEVLDRVGADLAGSAIALVLTDADGLVVARRAEDRRTRSLLDEIRLAPGFQYAEEAVGTNAIGTALLDATPTVVQADEHFANALTMMACAAVPISDPSTGRVLGVVDLSSAASDGNPLMLALAKQAAHEIEQRLLDGSSTAERLLQECFLRARRTSRGPLVAVSPRTLLVNAAASTLIETGERERLWAAVVPVLHRPGATTAFVTRAGQTLTLRCEPVLDGAQLVGALLRWAARERPRALSRPGTVGWGTVTEAELAVAMQVSNGLSNREAAAHLYLSPHTVDFHLRQLFRKLEVSSRVELTRLVLAHLGMAPG
ncbi:MAG: sigma factor [Frankiales bacterium]|nr:sigma factor [Frankiales bacterium]